MIPLRDLCFSGSFERKFLEQLTAYDLVWGFVNESWKCTSLHVHYVPFYLWRKSRNIGSKHFEPKPGSKTRRSYFRIKVEILGQCLLQNYLFSACYWTASDLFSDLLKILFYFTINFKQLCLLLYFASPNPSSRPLWRPSNRLSPVFSQNERLLFPSCSVLCHTFIWKVWSADLAKVAPY